MPFPIAALISWRPFYQSIDEPSFTKQNYDKISLDFQNFLRSGEGNGYFYGYAPFNHTMTIERLAENRNELAEAAVVSGVTVYFLARRPTDETLCVVGWYENADVFRDVQQGPICLPGNPKVSFRFRARHAFLFPEAGRPEVILRDLGLPPAQFKASIAYLNENNYEHRNAQGIAKLRHRLEELTDPNLQTESKEVVTTVQEFRRRKQHETIERSATYGRFRSWLGDTCYACGFGADGDPWSRALEMHHLVPMRELGIDEVRTVTPEEFALLCANCHRAIHATTYVGDVDAFWRVHRPKRGR